MRPALLFLSALLLLCRCSSVSTYDSDRGSSTSQTGNESGAGVQAPIWSSDPEKNTVTRSLNGAPNQ